MKLLLKSVVFLFISALVISVFCTPVSAVATVVSADVNQDNSVNICDLISLKKALVSSAEDYCDLNGDSFLSSSDLVIMRHFLLGEYAVVYRAFSSQHAIQYYQSGEEIVPPANPFYNSWTFTGWDGLPEIASENIIIVNALFYNSYDFPIVR